MPCLKVFLLFVFTTTRFYFYINPISFWLLPWHMEIPRPGIEPMPQLQIKPLQLQRYILNLLYPKRAPEFYYYYYYFGSFRAAPVAYGDSQARGWIGAATAGLHRSHSNVGAKPRLWPTPQLTAMPDPSPTSEAGYRTCILMDASQICFLWAMMGTPAVSICIHICEWPHFSFPRVYT